MVEDHDGLKTEALLRKEEPQVGWLALAEAAIKIGDGGAFVSWIGHEVLSQEAVDEEGKTLASALISESLSSGQQLISAIERLINLRQQQMSQLRMERAALLTDSLERQSTTYGDTSALLVDRIIAFANHVTDTGAPQTAILLLSKALGREHQQTSSSSKGPSEPLALPLVSPEKLESVRAILTRFLEGPTPTLTPDLAARARRILIDALRAQGRFEEATREEAALVESEDSSSS